MSQPRNRTAFGRLIDWLKDNLLPEFIARRAVSGMNNQPRTAPTEAQEGDAQTQAAARPGFRLPKGIQIMITIFLAVILILIVGLIVYGLFTNVFVTLIVLATIASVWAFKEDKYELTAIAAGVLIILIFTKVHVGVATALFGVGIWGFKYVLRNDNGAIKTAVWILGTGVVCGLLAFLWPTMAGWSVGNPFAGWSIGSFLLKTVAIILCLGLLVLSVFGFIARRSALVKWGPIVALLLLWIVTPLPRLAWYTLAMGNANVSAVADDTQNDYQGKYGGSSNENTATRPIGPPSSSGARSGSSANQEPAARPKIAHWLGGTKVRIEFPDGNTKDYTVGDTVTYLKHEWKIVDKFTISYVGPS